MFRHSFFVEYGCALDPACMAERLALDIDICIVGTIVGKYLNNNPTTSANYGSWGYDRQPVPVA